MDGDWHTPIDAYCERTDPGFWAEPLNALTNLSFFLAAGYGLMLFRRTGDRGVLVLAIVAACVGTGSFLFHTVATRWAALADVLPIAVFIAIGFGLVMRRLVGLPVWLAAGATVAFMGLSPFAAEAAEPVFGSSAGYVPTLSALLLVGGGLLLAGRTRGRLVLATGAVFAVSLGFRMADLPLCDHLPLGTHIGWHLLNGVVLALVMRSVVLATTGRS